MGVSADPIDVYPGDDSLYYMDWTKLLYPTNDTILTVDAVAIEDVEGNALSGFTVDLDSLEPNGAAFNNDDGNEVAIGKAALFRAQGGVKGVNYYAAVTTTTVQGNTRTRPGLFRCKTR